MFGIFENQFSFPQSHKVHKEKLLSVLRVLVG